MMWLYAILAVVPFAGCGLFCLAAFEAAKREDTQRIDPRL
jgi:hypothetical protein